MTTSHSALRGPGRALLLVGLMALQAGCTGTAEPSCSSNDECSHLFSQVTDQCQEARCVGGVCSVGPKLRRPPCDDGDPCTHDERCSSAGQCVSTEPRQCPADAGGGGTDGGGPDGHGRDVEVGADRDPGPDLDPGAAVDEGVAGADADADADADRDDHAGGGDVGDADEGGGAVDGEGSDDGAAADADAADTDAVDADAAETDAADADAADATDDGTGSVDVGDHEGGDVAVDDGAGRDDAPGVDDTMDAADAMEDDGTADATAADGDATADAGPDDHLLGVQCDDESDCAGAPCEPARVGRTCARSCVDWPCPDGFVCLGEGAEALCRAGECAVDGLAPAERCNGVDDDCDGETDEDWPELGAACDGPDADACALGRWACAPDEDGVICEEAAEAAATEERCNGVDDDCDGETDEDWPTLGDACDSDDGDSCATGKVACTADGAGVWCPTASEATPDQVERCNGLDDDCDGATDEDWPTLSEACDSDDGDACATGKVACTEDGAGVWCPAASEATPDQVERCNGADDDCDGDTDEDWPLLGLGCDGDDADQCALGRWVCGDEAASIRCDEAADTQATAERCNGVDDDCDGETDELWPTLGEPCDSDDSDRCANGRIACTDDGLDVHCPAAGESPASIAERCNGVDDDCDGDTDEDWPTLGDACDSDDADLCALGEVVCRADGSGAWCPRAGESARDRFEVCNGVDDDCDGETDEDFPDLGLPCDSDDSDRCALGELVCTPDGTDVHCPRAGEARVDIVERCNGQDDDCDGAIDEGFPLKGAACDSDDSDDCALGQWACTEDGTGLECPRASESRANIPERCNGEDDDCDGATDEDFPLLGAACDSDDSDQCANGQWSCAPDGRTLECLRSSEAELDITEACNGEDDDCDGATDELWPALGDPCDSDDSDACANGEITCSVDGTTTTCPASSETSRDIPERCSTPGVDDDCDGETDEPNAAGCTTFYADRDGDGHGTPDDTRCLCAAADPYDSDSPWDCNDVNPEIHRFSQGFCGADGDCDGDPVDVLEECDDENENADDACHLCMVLEREISDSRATTFGGAADVVVLTDGGAGTAWRHFAAGESAPESLRMQVASIDGNVTAGPENLLVPLQGQISLASLVSQPDRGVAAVWPRSPSMGVLEVMWRGLDHRLIPIASSAVIARVEGLPDGAAVSTRAASMENGTTAVAVAHFLAGPCCSFGMTVATHEPSTGETTVLANPLGAAADSGLLLDLAFSPSGKMVVLWLDSVGHDTGNANNVAAFASVYDESGALSSVRELLSVRVLLGSSKLAISMPTDELFTVAWSAATAREDATTTAVVAADFDVNGNGVGVDARRFNATDGHIIDLDLAAARSGHQLVTWIAEDDGGVVTAHFALDRDADGAGLRLERSLGRRASSSLGGMSAGASLDAADPAPFAVVWSQSELPEATRGTVVVQRISLTGDILGHGE